MIYLGQYSIDDPDPYNAPPEQIAQWTLLAMAAMNAQSGATPFTFYAATERLALEYLRRWHGYP